MSLVYRVLREVYARTPYDGEGAYRFGGRWSSPGTRVSYASEHQSLAMLEYFVHLDADDPPPDLVLVIAEVPDDLPRERVTISRLPSNWRETPAPDELTHFGDEFVRRGQSVLLLVPSALTPAEHNVLVNPAHPGFRKILVQAIERLLLRGEHRLRKRK